MTLPSTLLQASRATWVQIDVSGSNWPILVQGSYYWIVLAPGTTLSLSGNAYNGVSWSGINTSVTSGLPSFILNDPSAFTGRQLESSRFANDAPNICSASSALTWIRSASSWSSVPNAATRFINWQALGSPLRYGLQVLGMPYSITPSQTPSCE